MSTPVAPMMPTIDGDSPLDLNGADLYGADLQGADLADADLRHADLRCADLTGATLRGARLNNADLSHADLRSANLSGADLNGADLSGADLREAELSGADVEAASFEWARLHGALGLPEALRLRERAGDRVAGPTDADGAPAAATRSWQRGLRAHKAGELGLAERHMREVLLWDDSLSVAHYGLGCVALERGDVDAARRHWRRAVEQDEGADRARLELSLITADKADAERLLEPLCSRDDAVGAAARSARAAAKQGELAGQLAATQELLGESPSVRWTTNQRDKPTHDKEPRRPDESVVLLGDEEWVAQELDSLRSEVREKNLPPWRLHGIIARAVSIGALDVATLAEQKLRRVAPEQKLWALELKQLDITAQALHALVRTRSTRLGDIRSVRWVALGAHGPTARVDCEAGVYYAKRWQGAVRPPGSVAFTHRTMHTLAGAGLRTPVPLADAGGDDAMLFAGDLLALYPEIAGRSIREDQIALDEARQVGQLLARVHLLGQAVSGVGRPPGGLRAGTRILRHRDPSAAWEHAMAQNRKAATWWEHHPERRAHDGALRALGRRLAGVAGRCRVGLCHGDFGAGNVLFDGEDGGVIDWELCDRDLWVWDLARCIDRLGVHWSLGRPVELRANVVEALVSAYDSTNPLNDAERMALPLLVAASRVDLDASVTPLCAPIEPESVEPIIARSVRRLHRGAAGFPELHEALPWRT